jgi:GTP-binding protein YchF
MIGLLGAAVPIEEEGRCTVSLSVGIAGLPNVGKSTLLNALTHANAAASNYPFCTIESNVGVTPVPDPDLRRLEALLSPKETVPTTIRFVDIAGLVKGASEGEGLGNTFLGHIREVDAILHVVRCFANDDVVHTTGEPDPVRDVEVVETELLLADLETATRAQRKWAKMALTGKDAGKAEAEAFARAVEALGRGKPISAVGFSAEERELLGEARFLTAKPSLYVANTDESDPTGKGPLPSALRDAMGAERVLPVAVGIEEEISELEPAEQQEFLKELGLEETALDLVVTACYRLLGLITFYTIAHDRLSAWQLRRGGAAAEAAGKIHSDMEEGFIRAEVVSLGDLLRLGTRQALHDQGLIRIAGRDYEVRDKDVLQFHFRA